MKSYRTDDCGLSRRGTKTNSSEDVAACNRQGARCTGVDASKTLKVLRIIAIESGLMFSTIKEYIINYHRHFVVCEKDGIVPADGSNV